MKTQLPSRPSLKTRLNDWVQSTTCPCSLVLGSGCGCDIQDIEQSVCRLLNRARDLHGLRFQWLDFEDVRYLAGQPELRNTIMQCTGIGGDRYLQWNDSELLLRGLASIGGLVLGGEAALDATKDLPNVCRIKLCDCDVSSPVDFNSTIDFKRIPPNQWPTEVMSGFLDWMTGHPYGLDPSFPASSEICRMKRGIQSDTLMLT